MFRFFNDARLNEGVEESKGLWSNLVRDWVRLREVWLGILLEGEGDRITVRPHIIGGPTPDVW